MKLISILIPCLNEADNVREMAVTIDELFQNELSGYRYELLFIDNFSTDGTRDELRLICRGLVLPDVQALPVVTILRRAVAAHQARTGAEISLQMPDSLPELSPEARTCAYRFVQETLNNGFRHSGAAGMSVCVVAERGGIAITVSDAGCGFDPGRDTAGLGLIGLRERVRGLRGEFRLHSAAGQGTSVGMWLPPDAGGDDSESGVA